MSTCFSKLTKVLVSMPALCLGTLIGRAWWSATRGRDRSRPDAAVTASDTDSGRKREMPLKITTSVKWLTLVSPKTRILTKGPLRLLLLPYLGAGGGDNMAHDGMLDANKTIRVFVASRIRLYREGLAQLLRLHPLIWVVGAADPGDDILPVLVETAPDVLLLDVNGRGGLSPGARLAVQLPRIRILGLAVEDVEAQVIACAEAGLSGYVPCNASVEELITAVCCRRRDAVLRYDGRWAVSACRPRGTRPPGAGSSAHPSSAADRAIDRRRIIEQRNCTPAFTWRLDGKESRSQPPRPA
jgi:hypothetical protein